MPRPVHPDERRPRHGSLCRRPCGFDRASRSEERRARWSFHWRRRGGALSGTAWRKPGGEGCVDQRGAAAHGEDGEKSRRSSQRSVRWITGAARGQSLAILSRPAVGAILWLQSTGRESVGGDHPELVAPGHDGRRKGALRWYRRLLTDRFHRRSEEDRRACTGDAWRRRSDRSLRRCRAIVRQAAKEWDAEDLQ